MIYQFLLMIGACTSGGQTEPPLVDRPEPRAPEASADEPVEVVDPNDEPRVPPTLLGDYETLFNPTHLQEIRLTLSVASIEALNLDGSTFVPARFEHGGNVLDIGLRLKGSSTYQDFDGKPAFRLKFDDVVRKQEYASLTRLALNNLTGDPAQGREVVSYLAWEAGGMPAPRASLARVYVNDEYYGLYAVVEAMDEAWLKRRFVDPSGDLWAANDHADLTAEGVANFQLNHGEGIGPVTLTQAAAALVDHSSDFATQASAVVDFDQFLDFWAWSVATGGQDGYP